MRARSRFRISSAPFSPPSPALSSVLSVRPPPRHAASSGSPSSFIPPFVEPLLPPVRSLPSALAFPLSAYLPSSALPLTLSSVGPVLRLPASSCLLLDSLPPPFPPLPVSGQAIPHLAQTPTLLGSSRLARISVFMRVAPRCSTPPRRACLRRPRALCVRSTPPIGGFLIPLAYSRPCSPALGSPGALPALLSSASDSPTFIAPAPLPPGCVPSADSVPRFLERGRIYLALVRSSSCGAPLPHVLSSILVLSPGVSLALSLYLRIHPLVSSPHSASFRPRRGLV